MTGYALVKVQKMKITRTFCLYFTPFLRIKVPCYSELRGVRSANSGLLEDELCVLLFHGMACAAAQRENPVLTESAMGIGF